MTIQELQELLRLNDRLLQHAIEENDTETIKLLMHHRSIVKDTLIASLEFELFENFLRKSA